MQTAIMVTTMIMRMATIIRITATSTTSDYALLRNPWVPSG
jgi:hypothetical protein